MGQTSFIEATKVYEYFIRMAPVLVVINLAVFVQMIQEVTVFVMMRI
jgi:hypothetical protein